MLPARTAVLQLTLSQITVSITKEASWTKIVGTLTSGTQAMKSPGW